MKKILIIIVTVNSFLTYSAEHNFSKFYKFHNSLVSHFNPDDRIIVRNETDRVVCIFNGCFFMTSEGKKFFHIGFVIPPRSERKVDLRKILNTKKIKILEVYDYSRLLRYVKEKPQKPKLIWMCPENIARSSLVPGSKYTIMEAFWGELSIRRRGVSFIA